MIKKIAFLIGFTVLGLLMFNNVASAEMNSTELQLYNANKATYPHYVLVDDGNGRILTLWTESSRVYVHDANGVVSDGTFIQYVSTAGGNYSRSGPHSGTSIFAFGRHPLKTLEEILDSTNTNIYKGPNTNEVFFHAPNPYVIATTEMVGAVPKTMMDNLVDGGVLLVALMVLAILLAVYWMVRYLRSRVL